MTLQDDVQGAAQDLAKGFGPNRNQKFAVIGGYAGLSLITIIWSLSGGGVALSNAIGAEVELHSDDIDGSRWLTVTNASEEPWTHVDMGLNKGYVLTRADDVEPGDTIQVLVSEFAYEFHIPRPARLTNAAVIMGVPPQRSSAPPDMAITRFQLRTDQGDHTLVWEDAE